MIVSIIKRPTSITLTQIIIRSSSSTSSSSSPPPPSNRPHPNKRTLLNHHLTTLNINPHNIASASSLSNPDLTFYNYFGPSAVKCYRSFINSKDDTNVSLERNSDLSFQRAKQIEFLSNKWSSSESPLVRHTDLPSLPLKKFPLTLILSNLRSSHNVGSLLRLASTSSLTSVILIGTTPSPFGPGSLKVRKTSLGAENEVPVMHFKTDDEALVYCQAEGMEIYGAETTSFAKDYSEAVYFKGNKRVCESDSTKKEWKGGTAIMLGNEVHGLTMNVMQSEMVKGVISIPSFGKKGSLNVSVAGGILVYNVLKSWGFRMGEQEEEEEEQEEEQ